MIGVITYNTPHLIYWDWRIAADLFLGGIGVGAYLIAVINSLVYRDRYARVSKVGAILAPLFVIAGLGFLLLELGHPLRMWRTITGFNISSPLSWGGLFQTLMIIIGIMYAYLWTKPNAVKLRNMVGVIGIPIALVVGGYHGWLLTIIKARPLWNTGPSTITALLSFVITGMAAILLILCLLPKARRAGVGAAGDGGSQESGSATWMIRDFRHLLVGAMIVQGLTFFIWWISLYYGSADAHAALLVANAALGPLFWSVGIGAGLVIPIGLQLMAMVRDRGRPERAHAPLTILTTVLILVGAFVFRYAVVVAGQLG